MDSIIFDVDGTMWDTTGICAEAWNKAIEDNSNIKPGLTGEQLMHLFGKPMNVIFAAVFPELSQDERDRLSVICCEYESRYLKSQTVPTFPGLHETVRRLSEKYPLFIVSNCQKGYIEEFLENTGLKEFFKDYMCYGDTLASKGTTMRRLIERNGLTSPVYVGDTQGDRDACTEAGVPFVYAAYGFGEVNDYWKKIDSISGLMEIF